MQFPTRIPCGAHIQIYVAGSTYNRYTGLRQMIVTVSDMDNPNLSRTFVAIVDNSISWGADAMTIDRVVSIAQTSEGRHGSYQLGAQWTLSSVSSADTGGTLSTFPWSQWKNGVGFESYPDRVGGVWSRPVVTTSTPPNRSSKDAEIVSIDAR